MGNYLNLTTTEDDPPVRSEMIVDAHKKYRPLCKGTMRVAKESGPAWGKYVCDTCGLLIEE